MTICTFLLNMLSIVFTFYKKYYSIYNKFTIPSSEGKYYSKQHRENAILVDNFHRQILFFFFFDNHYTS